MLSRTCRFGAPAAALVSLLSSVLFASPASAVPIVGRLSLLGTLSLNSDGIDFQPPSSPFVGNFLTSLPSGGYFAGITGSGTALALDLSTIGPVSVSGFLSSFQPPFETLLFELELIQPGAFDGSDCAAAPASGQVCTPDGSPFSFVNFSTGSGVSSIVSFVLQGKVAANGGDAGVFTAVYTAQFTGLSYQQVRAAIAAGGSVTASYSADIDAIPEPGAAALLGGGLFALALLRRSTSRARR